MNLAISPPYTLLVNSCDSFSDCWTPFFTLLDRYWPRPHPPILLNTEKRDWSDARLEMSATRVQARIDRRLTWSECLEAALAQVKTPLVLYMQEDYFIESPVDAKRIDTLAQRMLESPEIGHIGLTHFGAGNPLLPNDAPGLSRVGAKASYRISTQAGLWQVDTLRSYILEWENAWMFELFGTVRSWKRNELFLTLDRTATKPAINYQHTGIVKGQWSAFVPALFERERIDMDFDKRGFSRTDISAIARRMKLLAQVVRHPGLAARSLLAA